ncbi:insulinase family protein [Algibacillus agarilyticus]|uniref:insulinase family protein n=1 Tax=Algibacillus agarilyticus TaxID=2234133 RepID=UPI000DD0CD3C|nr:insulinase family protein [Algibacillus agarilyticus]
MFALKNQRWAAKFFSFALISVFIISCKTTTPNYNTFKYALFIPGAVDKSPSDYRDYDTFNLANGLEVIVISDPNVSDSVATLTVGAGYYQDPETLPGLAHYLEHMVWSSSKKYPQTNGFQQLMAENNGYTNAYTLNNQTQYLFSITENKFELALDMFSSAIASPLLDPTDSDKERTAINEEWRRMKENDSFSISRVNALTTNPQHPNHKFGGGNLATLQDTQEQTLQDAMQAFHQQYYSANIMKLVIASKQDTATLKSMVEKYFNQIENKQIEKPTVKSTLYLPSDLTQHIHVKTKIKGQRLGLQFPMANNTSRWQNKSNLYIYRLLNSEEPDSLKHTLKTAGLIVNMGTYLDPSRYDNSGEFYFDIELTEKGAEQKDTIIAAVFNYVTLIKQQGIQTAYYKQMKKTIHKSWRQSAPPAIFDLVYHMAIAMQTYPAKHVLTQSQVALNFAPKEIEQILSAITPQNMRVWHLTPDSKADKPIQYADGLYNQTPFTAADYNAWQSTSFTMQLPPTEYSAVVAENVAIQENINHPIKLETQASTEAWLMNSQHFTDTSGILRIQIQTPDSLKNVKHFVMSHLINNIYSRKNAALRSRSAEQYQVELYDSSNAFGMTELTFVNETQYHASYAKDLIQRYINLEITADDIAIEIKAYVDSLESYDKSTPEQLLYDELYTAIKMPPLLWSNEQRLAALADIKLDDVKTLHQKMLKHNYIYAFAFGHYQPKNISNVIDTLRTELGTSSLTEKWQFKSAFQFNHHDTLNIKTEIKAADVGIINGYVLKEKSLISEMQLYVLNQLLSQSLYSELRTKQQMGYAVYSHPTKLHGYPAINLLVQSGNTSLPNIKRAFDEFLPFFAQELASTPDNVIQQITSAMIANANERPNNLLAEASKFENDWFHHKVAFDSYQTQLAALAKIDKTALIELFNRVFINGESHHLIIQVKGNEFKDSDFYQSNGKGSTNNTNAK